MYYCVIVAFCQHVLNEHAMLCYAVLSLHVEVEVVYAVALLIIINN